MREQPDWNHIMRPLVRALALEVAAELRPAIAAAVALVSQQTTASQVAPVAARLSTRDAAAYAGVRGDTLRKWASRGLIPVRPHRLGSRLLVWERAELDAWLASRRGSG